MDKASINRINITLPRTVKEEFELRELDPKSGQFKTIDEHTPSCRGEAIGAAKILHGLTGNRVQIVRKEVIGEIWPDNQST